MRRLHVPRGPRALAGACVVAGMALVATSPAIAGSDSIHASGPLTLYGDRPTAHASIDVRYDTTGQSHLDLRIAGLAPDTSYVVRAHAGPCSDTRLGLGPVFQSIPNPNPDTPLHPDYVNDSNEIWLDAETDAQGNAASHADQPWQPSPTWRPASVVVHEALVQTHPNAPRVGKALACLDVPF